MNHSLYSGLTLPHSHCLWKQYHNSVVPSKLNSTNIWAPSWCFLMVDPSQTLLHSQAITSSHLCPEKMQLWSPPVPSTYLFHPPSCCLTLNRSLNFQAFFQPSDSFTNYCQHFFFFFSIQSLATSSFSLVNAKFSSLALSYLLNHKSHSFKMEWDPPNPAEVLLPNPVA